MCVRKRERERGRKKESKITLLTLQMVTEGKEMSDRDAVVELIEVIVSPFY